MKKGGWTQHRLKGTTKKKVNEENVHKLGKLGRADPLQSEDSHNHTSTNISVIRSSSPPMTPMMMMPPYKVKTTNIETI